jgi:hypothetical protein
LQYDAARNEVFAASARDLAQIHATLIRVQGAIPAVSFLIPLTFPSGQVLEVASGEIDRLLQLVWRRRQLSDLVAAIADAPLHESAQINAAIQRAMQQAGPVGGRLVNVRLGGRDFCVDSSELDGLLIINEFLEGPRRRAALESEPDIDQLRIFIHMFPVIGLVTMGAEAATGRSIFGRQLGSTERALVGISAVLGIIGAVGSLVARGASLASTASRIASATGMTTRQAMRMARLMSALSSEERALVTQLARPLAAGQPLPADQLAQGQELIRRIIRLAGGDADLAAVPGLGLGARGYVLTSAMRQTASELVARLRSTVGRVVVNIGGQNAPGELANVINLNPLASEAPRDVSRIPNLVRAPGELVGEIFEPGAVDEITSRLIERGWIDWNTTARGSIKALTPGGRISIVPFGAQNPEFVRAIASALEEAGFVQVTQTAGLVRGVKPL